MQLAKEMSDESFKFNNPTTTFGFVSNLLHQFFEFKAQIHKAFAFEYRYRLTKCDKWAQYNLHCYFQNMFVSLTLYLKLSFEGN